MADRVKTSVELERFELTFGGRSTGALLAASKTPVNATVDLIVGRQVRICTWVFATARFLHGLDRPPSSSADARREFRPTS